MERDRQFDNAEAGTKMATGDRDCIYGFLPELGRQLDEIPLRQRAQILWRLHPVEQRGLRSRRRSKPIGSPLSPLVSR